jgi:TATA-box binding protein (TBP) (component of TFIID and TFIIIB)
LLAVELETEKRLVDEEEFPGLVFLMAQNVVVRK